MGGHSTPLAVKPNQGPCFALAGNALRTIVGGEETAGQYALLEFVVAPGVGAPPHVHSREDEAFHILEGTVVFVVGGREISAGPGDFVHAPRDIPHLYQNRSSTPARMTVLAVPAGVERFFAEAGSPLPDLTALPRPSSPREIERLLATAPKYGLRILTD